MYELHMPIIMLTQMQLQSGFLSRDQVHQDKNLAHLLIIFNIFNVLAYRLQESIIFRPKRISILL